MVQLELQMSDVRPAKPSLCDVVLDLMRDKGWWTIWGLQRAIESREGKHYMETTLSSRVRDLRKVEYGSHEIESRPRTEGGGWEFRLIQ